MKRSTERILVSHAGNLPRPPEMQKLLEAKDIAAYKAKVPEGVRWIVDRQISLGVDVVNDGEYIKAGSYGGYIHDRWSGFEWKPTDPSRKPRHAAAGGRDRAHFPGMYESGLWLSGSGGPVRPGFATPGRPVQGGGGRERPGETRINTGPVTYTGQAKVKADTVNLSAAINGKNVDGFLAAIGPCSPSSGSFTDHYRTDDEYLFGTAEALHEEYKAITDAGLILQIDEPNLATAWQFYPDMTVEQYRKYTERNIEAINHALRGIPQDQVRLHFCWGSGHRPHVYDIELKHIVDIILGAKVRQISYEAANVRHEHEWRVFEDIKLPDGMILMPGVISHATDLVEHPELVADRIVRLAGLVGRENVVTGTDCGIGSRVGHEEIVWAKLKAMSEGARLATQALWGKVPAAA